MPAFLRVTALPCRSLRGSNAPVRALGAPRLFAWGVDECL